MPRPEGVQPPTPENVAAYRAAALAYRNAWREELRRHKDHRLANAHVALHAAALAVQKVMPELTLSQADTFAQRAVAWVGQAHNAWLWS